MNALILVDLQNDFMPGGALAVPKGDEVIQVAQWIAPGFDLVVATQDWHPANHGSFASQHAGRRVGEVIELNGLTQVLWPDHCVQSTRGAALVDGLDTSRITRVFQKGTDPAVDSYSGFFDNGRRKATGLGEYLRSCGVTDVYVMGLATDYCVKFTAMDARELGFNVTLLRDGVRGVELSPGDCQRAIKTMRNAGVRMAGLADILR